MMQNVLAIVVRKNTTSIAGMCDTCFTNIFAREKASVDRNIARTPSVRNLSSLINGSFWFGCARRASAVVAAVGLSRKRVRFSPQHRRGIDRGRDEYQSNDYRLKVHHSNPSARPPWYVINAA